MKRRIKQKKLVDWPIGSITPPFLDPLGSYTGIPTDPEEIPVQDADDL